MVNIKVAVRVRPISTRESKNCGSSVVVYTEENKISLTNLKVPLNKAGDSRERTRKYDFHYCFDSSDPRSKNYADQAKIYEILGKSLLDDLFTRRNSCLLAYGQTASGKTYTVMGTEDEPGLTPRLCHGIFARIDEERNKGNIFDVSVSYLEIYNERVRDLLEPSSNSHRSLRVREHPRLGPYVQGLTHRVARTLERLMSYVDEGTKARRAVSTKQNPNSSRSHALLTVFLSPKTTRTVEPIEKSVDGKRVSKQKENAACTLKRNLNYVPRYGSKLHLVDLAGSETAQNCGGVRRLKEGANINKSLVALGNVISALTLTGRTSTFASTNKRYIPYRDSSLTWLLKDALGGNATTIMLATISPASRNYNETAHTLRFAQRAHSVVNKPVVNEDPMERTIRELKAEIAWLKSLLMEKNIKLETKSLSYREQRETTNNDSTRRMTRTMESDTSKTKRTILRSLDDGILPTIRRMNSSENLATRNNNLITPAIRKYGSYECLDGKNSSLRTGYSYNRAEISELEYEEKELVGEINEAVFVDIPTLVAVLIKPDNTFDENNSSTQIEEICSEEIHEYQMEQDFIGENDGCEMRGEIVATSRRDKLANGDYEQEESHFDLVSSNTIDIIGPCNEANDRNDSRCVIDSIERKEKSKTPVKGSTNLYTLSRRFGSAEILEKKRDRLTTLERSHTNLEKQAAVPEETDERYNEDSKNGSYANLWKEANKPDNGSHLQRTGSNESDKMIKDNSSMLGTNKIRNNAARKPSLESLKRKTSKDSSSSSSKDEQILFSNLPSERTIRRKDSLDHNAFTRTHTPVQRVKRAEIVAAVTERLYSSRKQVEETVTGMAGSTPTSTTLVSSTSASSTSGIRSPPEGTDVRTTTINSPFTTKSKLQEISRKMLAKRRRVNVDTQTEQMQTIRMKDSSSSTDESKILCQDVGILTDEHNVHETKIDHRLPIVRVKEIATLTDKLKDNVTESKDAECLVNDLNFYEYGVHFLNDDRKKSSENAGYSTSNKICNTDSLELYLASSDKVDRFDKSTSTTTRLPVEPSPIVQVQPRPLVEENCDVVAKDIKENSSSSMEKPERNVISMNLPDAISITIETTNFVESKVVLMEDTIEDTRISSNKRDMHRLKNNESQTEKQNIERNDKDSNLYMGGFSTKTNVNQTDNKCFRIENIFKDPRNLSGGRAEKVLSMPSEKEALKASVTFTNSLGTCFVPETKECATGMDKGQTLGREWPVGRSGDESEEIFRRERRSRVRSDRNIEDTFRRSVDVWKNWIISFPPTSWQRPRNLLSPVNVEPWTFAWNGALTPSDSECTAIVSSTNLRRSSKETAQSSSNLFFSNDLYDKDQASDSLKSPSLINRINTKGIVEQDYNFSDDSLDYNEENLLSSNTNNNKIEIPEEEEEEEEEEGFENVCPPDVVAQTKSSMLIGNAHDDVEDNQIELSKRELSNSKSETSVLIRDHNSSNSEQCSDDVNQQDNSRETRIKHQEKSSDCMNDTFKKRVTFFDNENLIKRVRESQSGGNSPLNRNWNFPKAVIEKKTHDDSKVIEDHLENKNKTKADLTEDNATLQEKTKFINVFKIANDKNVKSFKNENSLDNSCDDFNSYDDIDIYRNFIKNCDSLKLKRRVLEDYLNEATAFMRNINSLNEYVSNNTYICRGHQRDEKKKRGNHRRSFAPRNHENYEKVEDDLVASDASDDNLMAESLKENDTIAPTESFEKCLESLARLENCIRKANDHDRYLREKYNIVVESAGAKSGLANSSIDSSKNLKTTSNLTHGNSLVPLQEFLIRSEGTDGLLERTKEKEENENISDELYDTNNKIVCDHGELERKNFYRLTNGIPSCHYCYMKNTRIENSYGQRTYYDTCKFYHFHDDNKNSNDLFNDSFATIKDSAQLSTSALIKPTKGFERLEKSLNDNGSSRQTMADAFMNCTKSEMSNFINSKSLHRLSTGNTKFYSWKKLRYRPESPRAKFLELLRERRRIVESSRDVRS